MPLDYQSLRVVLVIVLIVLVFATAGSNNAADEEAIPLKYNLKVGDLLIYQMKGGSVYPSLTGGQLSMDAEGIRTQVVTEVSKEGIYSLLTADFSEITCGLTSVGRMDMGVERQKMRPDGSFVERKNWATDPVTTILISAGELPTKPVKKGESWKREVEIPSGGRLDIQWRLAGFQKIKDYDCAQLEGTFTSSMLPSINAIMAGNFTHFFAVKEGFMVIEKVEVRTMKKDGPSTANFKLEFMKKEALSPTQLQETVSALELAASGQNELYKNYEKAIEAFEKAIEVDLEPFRTYFLYPTLARAYLKAGRSYGYGPKDVLKLADALKKRAGNDAFSYVKLGDVYLAADKNDEAIEAYQKALELQPKSHYFKWKLAQAYEEAGDSQRAKQLYQEILHDLEEWEKRN